MKQILLLLFACLLSTSLWAQAAKSVEAPTTTVKGHLITEIDKSPLPYATISVTREATPKNTFRRVATDEKGSFSLSVPAGKYIFSFEFVGMKTLVRNVEIATESKQYDLGDIPMTESSTELAEVSVTAQRPLVKVEIDKLTYSAKDDPESTTSSVLDLLRKVPLVTVDGEDNVQLKGNTNFKIYMNGKPSNMLANNPSQVLKSMPANSIKDVEVITDPGAKYDAEGVGGIINIITDKRVDDGYVGSVSAGGDTNGGYNGSAFLTLKYGKWGFTGNGSYYNFRMPFSDSSLSRDDFSPNPINSLTQTGKSKNYGGGTFGNATLSYELDTLNLFSVSINQNRGKFNSRSEQSTLSEGAHNYGYLLNMKNDGQYGGTDILADYQRSFRKKGEMLTISYRFGQNPNNSNSETSISDVTGSSPYPDDYWQRGKSDAHGEEHTGQVDYVNPLTANHSIEMGLKYIFRDNTSESELNLWNSGTNQWEIDNSQRNDLDHRQKISSGYAGYTYKNGKYGAKVGVRGEYTKQDATFKALTDTTIDKNYFDLVPSATLSYQIGMTRTLRIGYNMRVYRPGIWHLNPYVNNANPLSIQYGNPELDAEKNHNFNINYGSFSQKLNFNASLSYSLTNNAISSYQFVENGITNSTYANIGKQQTIGLNTYVNWSPTTQFRIYLNGNIDYTDISSNQDSALKNNGFSGRAFTGATYTFPNDLRVSVNGGLFGSRIELQRKQSAFYFSSVNVVKSFLDKKLDVSLSVNSPFWKYNKIKNTTTGDGFRQESIFNRPMRTLSLNLTYRFGDLKSSINKVQRSITNDDVKAGGESGQGGQSGTETRN